MFGSHLSSSRGLNAATAAEKRGMDIVGLFTKTAHPDNRKATMKPRMTEQTVTETAQAFWDSQEALHLKTHGSPSVLSGLKVASVRPERRGKRNCRWVVQFSSRIPGGGVIDSPPFVIVHDDTGEAEFLEV